MVASYTQLLSQTLQGQARRRCRRVHRLRGGRRQPHAAADPGSAGLLAGRHEGQGTASTPRARRRCSRRSSNLRGAIEDSGARRDARPAADVLADETQLIQLFQNLVGNAIKYQSAGVPRVHIAARRERPDEVDVLGAGQRPGHRPAVLRADLRHVPAAAQARGIRRHRHRAGDLQEDRRAARRQHLGRVGARARALPFALHCQEASWQHETPSERGGMPIEVLLVEDSPGDVRLTQEAFRDANLAIHLHVASDGVEAMAFLRREGAHARRAAPGSDPAGSEPAEDGWARGAGADQGRRRA